MILQTERTVLSLIESSDLEAIHKLHSLPETDEFNTLGIPKSIEETEAVIAPWVYENKLDKLRQYTFAIRRLSDNEFIGLFGLKLGAEKYKRGEVWYKILPKFWNQGMATEVLRKVISYSFDELGLHRVQAGCAIENEGSIKVLEKVGMLREGRGRQVLPLKNGWSDNFEYAILDSDPRK